MRKRKYMLSNGLAFDEEKDMEVLASHSKEGWHVQKIGILGYWLTKGEAQHVQYSIDYEKAADVEYFSYFEEAGWEHVTTASNHIHLFKAPVGTKPIYTDKDTTIDKYEAEKNMMGKAAFPTLLVTILLFSLYPISNIDGVPSIIGEAGIVFGSLSAIVFLFTGLPYLGYRKKIQKLKRETS